MKNIFKYIMLLTGAGLAAGCSADKEGLEMTETRIITVEGIETRTTIDYEGSDYSHLVWKEGDQVAYATDLNGSTFKTAAISDSHFRAEIPTEADSENTLVALWPVAENAGRDLEGATAELKKEITQEAGTDFDGNLLPMYAAMPVPQGSHVFAEYRMLGSVIRFNVSASENEGEFLKSIRLTANEQLVGQYTLNREGGIHWDFEGKSNTVKTTMTGENEKLLLGSDDLYVYMVVNRASYTGVEVIVETNMKNYVFSDGAMDLNKEGRSLYKIDLNLSEGGESEPEPAETFFKPITDISELTADGTYLILTDDTESSYFTPSEKAQSEINYLSPKEVTIEENGIRNTDEISNLTWKIESDGTAYTLFSNYHKSYVRAPGGISYRVYGHIWMEESLADFEYDHVHFNISVDAEKAEIAMRHVDARLQYFTNSSNKMFCFCKPDAADQGNVQNIRIYKLYE